MMNSFFLMNRVFFMLLEIEKVDKASDGEDVVDGLVDPADAEAVAALLGEPLCGEEHAEAAGG